MHNGGFLGLDACKIIKTVWEFPLSNYVSHLKKLPFWSWQEIWHSGDTIGTGTNQWCAAKNWTTISEIPFLPENVQLSEPKMCILLAMIMTRIFRIYYKIMENIQFVNALWGNDSFCKLTSSKNLKYTEMKQGNIIVKFVFALSDVYNLVK